MSAKTGTTAKDDKGSKKRKYSLDSDFDDDDDDDDDDLLLMNSSTSGFSKRTSTTTATAMQYLININSITKKQQFPTVKNNQHQKSHLRRTLLQPQLFQHDVTTDPKIQSLQNEVDKYKSKYEMAIQKIQTANRKTHQAWKQNDSLEKTVEELKEQIDNMHGGKETGGNASTSTANYDYIQLKKLQEEHGETLAELQQYKQLYKDMESKWKDAVEISEISLQRQKEKEKDTGSRATSKQGQPIQKATNDLHAAQGKILSLQQQHQQAKSQLQQTTKDVHYWKRKYNTLQKLYDQSKEKEKQLSLDLVEKERQIDQLNSNLRREQRMESKNIVVPQVGNKENQFWKRAVVTKEKQIMELERKLQDVTKRANKAEDQLLVYKLKEEEDDDDDVEGGDQDQEDQQRGNDQMEAKKSPVENETTNKSGRDGSDDSDDDDDEEYVYDSE